MLLAVKSSVRSTLWSYCSCVCYSSSTWWEAFINIPGKSSPPHADSSLILYFPCPELRAMAELWNKDLKGQFSWMADVLAMLLSQTCFQFSPFRANLRSCELGGRFASVVLWLYWLYTQSNCLMLPAKHINIHTDVVMFFGECFQSIMCQRGNLNIIFLVWQRSQQMKC